MQLEQAKQRAIEIAEALHGRHIKGDLRSRLCAACFAVSQEHHNSILILLSRNPPLQATAFALLRPLTESTIRGLWLSHVATDEQVENYVQSGTKLDMTSMITLVGKAAGGNAHQTIYRHWSSLSAYTHTGEHQVQRWLLTENIEPSYSASALSELVNLTGVVAELAFQAVVAISSAK
ncbi:hypothetical protein LMK08_20365 [Metapseudomonas furukawaii]|uniref:DUF6988 family protein n=1 Tax=Metapseudomonas furukawaii TaxID=1149133 RepID=UPI00227ACD3C|nr:hypothetical protein [Pseudomonas furukawaii]WAG77696.1 hypothetical protein LMK08_20365 [Pseudomonas furukawaii]